jgi:hypothetical protein
MLATMALEPTQPTPPETPDDVADDARNFFDEELEHWIAAGST